MRSKSRVPPLSPSSSEFDHRSPRHDSPSSTTKVMGIPSLLNPTSCQDESIDKLASTSPGTPSSMAQEPASSTASPAPPSKQTAATEKKFLKNGAEWNRASPIKSVMFHPHESKNIPKGFSKDDLDEMIRQHERLNLFPRGDGHGGLISDYSRTIPYKSNKKSFNEETGLSELNTFQYTFKYPTEKGNDWTVIWDYSNGLTRITPFFKALSHAKTTPNKAIAANPGLEKVSHSITGGALAAQGYWMPYSCARALCLTFCYEIRWALTPLFGPAFAKECKAFIGDPSFKIDTRVLQAAISGEQKSNNTNANGPLQDNAQDIPGSTPVDSKAQTPTSDEPTFRSGSPFDAESKAPGNESATSKPAVDASAVSPKTNPIGLRSGWTSINRSGGSASASNDESPPLSNESPLAQPRSAPSGSWRPANVDEGSVGPAKTEQTIVLHGPRGNKRRRSSRLASTRGAGVNYAETGHSGEEISDPETAMHDVASTSSAASDDETSRPAAKKRKTAERVSKRGKKQTRASPKPPMLDENGGESRYTPEDFRAAHWLINLHLRDADLAKMRGEDVDGH